MRRFELHRKTRSDLSQTERQFGYFSSTPMTSSSRSSGWVDPGRQRERSHRARLGRGSRSLEIRPR
jgi:hypothetical protein